MMGKKTVSFDEGWADELIANGTMTQEEVDRLMKIIIDQVESWNPIEKDDDDEN